MAKSYMSKSEAMASVRHIQADNVIPTLTIKYEYQTLTRRHTVITVEQGVIWDILETLEEVDQYLLA